MIDIGKYFMAQIKLQIVYYMYDDRLGNVTNRYYWFALNVCSCGLLRK